MTNTVVRPFALAACVFSLTLSAAPGPVEAKPIAALKKAYISKTSPRKGVVIHLHGCDGLSTKGWTRAWFTHFERSGYRVYAPDGFSMKRPPAQCGENYARKGEVRRLRTRQFNAVLVHIQKTYPGKKVYVWGHSEGGQFVQRFALTSGQIAGAIVTGHSCGFGRAAKVYLAKDVPMVILLGAPKHDRFLHLELNYKRVKTMKALCAKALVSKSWTWRAFGDYGHILPIWERDVREAVNTVMPIKLGYGRVTSSPRTVDVARYKIRTAARRAHADKYPRLEGAKAFAIGPDGSWGYAYNASNPADAVTLALHWCNTHTRKARRRNNCALYDVNGQRTGSRPDRQTAERLQRALKAKGLYTGAVDGAWGAASAKAYAAFRTQAGLPKRKTVDLDGLLALGVLR